VKELEKRASGLTRRRSTVASVLRQDLGGQGSVIGVEGVGGDAGEGRRGGRWLKRW
jgi:hypothetical protein